MQQIFTSLYINFQKNIRLTGKLFSLRFLLYKNSYITISKVQLYYRQNLKSTLIKSSDDLLFQRKLMKTSQSKLKNISSFFHFVIPREQKLKHGRAGRRKDSRAKRAVCIV